MIRKTIKIKDGIILHCMNTEDRFKTNYIAINIFTKLNRETITKNALLPLVLRRGSKNYPTMQDISIKLESMYGASFDASNEKLGDNLSIQFVMDTISDDYTLDNGNILEEAINLICDVLLSPVLENSTFKEEYVQQEKETLKEIINSKINDKAQYSMDRTIEEMYQNEPYGIYKFGYVEDLEKINSQDLYNQYKNVLKESQINIYVSGKIDESKITEILTDKFEKVDRNYNEDNMAHNAPEYVAQAEFRDVLEKQNVTQGKLVLGYKLQSTNLAKDFYKMTVYNAILGGTASSKLFNNVREKKSLAYTIRSQYIKQKGAMLVSAGIELENYDIAKECILKEINDMKIGEITEQEINDAKVNLVTLYRSITDSQSALISWAIGQQLLKCDEDVNVVIDKINAITKEDVLDVANRLVPTIRYYLSA